MLKKTIIFPPENLTFTLPEYDYHLDRGAVCILFVIMCECVLKHFGSGTFKCILKPLINKNKKKQTSWKKKQAWVVTRFVCQHHKLHYCFIYFLYLKLLWILFHIVVTFGLIFQNLSDGDSFFPNSILQLLAPPKHWNMCQPVRYSWLLACKKQVVVLLFTIQTLLFRFQTDKLPPTTPQHRKVTLPEDVKVVCHSSSTEHPACTNSNSVLGYKRMSYFVLPGRRACCRSLLSVDFVQF